MRRKTETNKEKKKKKKETKRQRDKEIKTLQVSFIISDLLYDYFHIDLAVIKLLL